MFVEFNGWMFFARTDVNPRRSAFYVTSDFKQHDIWRGKFILD